MKDAIIVDLDGTVADIDHRLHFIKSEGKKDWMSFFKEMVNDTPKQNVLDIIKVLYTKYNVLILTGRPLKYRDVTLDWLHQHGFVFWNELCMRSDHDFSPSYRFKERVYENKIKDKYNIVAIFEDDPKVVEMWRAKGLTCFQVDDWE